MAGEICGLSPHIARPLYSKGEFNKIFRFPFLNNIFTYNNSSALPCFVLKVSVENLRNHLFIKFWKIYEN